MGVWIARLLHFFFPIQTYFQASPKVSNRQVTSQEQWKNFLESLRRNKQKLEEANEILATIIEPEP